MYVSYTDVWHQNSPYPQGSGLLLTALSMFAKLIGATSLGKPIGIPSITPNERSHP